jgi:hypothetical protein
MCYAGLKAMEEKKTQSNFERRCHVEIKDKDQEGEKCF